MKEGRDERSREGGKGREGRGEREEKMEKGGRIRGRKIRRAGKKKTLSII